MMTFKPVHLLLPLLLLVSSWAQAGSQYSRIYIFGDSLSDTGNLASIIGAFPPPYYMNRVSNGPVAVDVLASKLGLDATASLHLIGPASGSNYAVAGANAFGDEAIDLDTQVLMFLANHGYVAPDDALYVVFIGGNDIRTARDDPNHISAINTVTSAVTQVKQAIMDLGASGAQSFLLINAPNVGVIPETRLISAAFDEPAIARRATLLSRLYRRDLHRMARQLEHQQAVQITEFDLFSYFNKLVRQGDRYGFTNVTEACFSSDSLSFHPDCDSGLNFDQFIFFDEIHPTARVHALVGEALFATLSKKSPDIHWRRLHADKPFQAYQ